jgi:hypothetical protein
MTTRLKSGAVRPVDWKLKQDEAGHRTYTVQFYVTSDDKNDGPFVVLNTPGLPQPGQWWIIGNDADEWATCLPEMSITPVVTKEPTPVWMVEQTFSTKPLPHNAQRCNEQPVGDPLLEPAKISGGSTKYTEEAAFDRFSRPIVNSAFEQLRGHQVEFDANRFTVKFEANVPSLDLAFIDSFINCVNDAPMWGYPRRCVKFQSRHWDRQFYGECEAYFKLSLEFEVWVRSDGTSGFDRDLLDEGTKALHGQNIKGNWVLTPLDDLGTMPDYRNPAHYVRYKDQRGENAKCILDGFGKPIHGASGTIKLIYRMSISNSHTPGDINNPTKWVTLNEPPPPGLFPDDWWEWEVGIIYNPGDLITYENPVSGADTFWVCIVSNADSTLLRPPDNPTCFVQLTSIVNRGTYNPGASYAVGDYVVGDQPGTGTGVATQPGKIHVEKYDERNLFLLGLPGDIFSIT